MILHWYAIGCSRHGSSKWFRLDLISISGVGICTSGYACSGYRRAHQNRIFGCLSWSPWVSLESDPLVWHITGPVCLLQNSWWRANIVPCNVDMGYYLSVFLKRPLLAFITATWSKTILCSQDRHVKGGLSCLTSVTNLVTVPQFAIIDATNFNYTETEWQFVYRPTVVYS